MKPNDVLIFGTFRYTVLKVKHNRVLLAWTESDGTTKELWLILSKLNTNNLRKAA